MVDDQDYDALSPLTWRKSKGGYAIRSGTKNCKPFMVQMHRLIASAPKGSIVDHINRNPLDNRRANLRICSHRENTRNNRRGKGLCVTLHRCGRWQAALWSNEGRQIYLGLYATKAIAVGAVMGAERALGIPRVRKLVSNVSAA